MRFEFDETAEESRTKIILKKAAFCLGIFIFETFIPWLAGFQVVLALFMNYFIASILSLIGAADLAEFAINDLKFTIVIGAVFIILLHLLYHIIIKGLLKTKLLVELNIELYAVFLFFSFTESTILSMAKYMYLIAACSYSVIVAVFFTVKYFKYKK